MLNIFHDRLSIPEQNIFVNAFESISYSDYRFINVKKDDEVITKDELLNSRLLFVFAPTKSKSSFEKRMETLYGADIMQKGTKIIPPSLFMKDQALKDETWSVLMKVCDVPAQILDSSLINNLPEELKKSIYNIDRIFTIQDKNGNSVTVYPDHFESIPEDGLKASEFLILVAASKVFHLDRMEIR